MLVKKVDGDTVDSIIRKAAHITHMLSCALVGVIVPLMILVQLSGRAWKATFSTRATSKLHSSPVDAVILQVLDFVLCVSEAVGESFWALVAEPGVVDAVFLLEMLSLQHLEKELLGALRAREAEVGINWTVERHGYRGSLVADLCWSKTLVVALRKTICCQIERLGMLV